MPVSKKGKLIGNISVRIAAILLTVMAFLLAALSGYFFDKNEALFWTFAILSIILGTLATLLSERHFENRIHDKIKESESYLKALIEYQKKGRQAV